MKTQWTFICAVALFLAVTSTARAATVTWDGGGGDFSWQNPLNWNTDALPGPFDNVVINAGANVTITSSANVTNFSVQCSNNLALTGGRFKVTSGNSLVQGDLSVSGFPTLVAEGFSTFTVAGAVNANGASFEANAGAVISLPNLKSYSAGFVCFTLSWSANGAGSALNFPGLTNVTGNSCSGFSVQALNGGNVLLTNLASVTDGNLTILADGTGSLVDMPVFVEAVNAVRSVSLEARNNGTVSVPQLKRGPTLAFTLNPGATLPTAQLESAGSITVNALAISFPALTNFTAGSFTVTSNAVVTVPNLTTYNKGGACSGSTWNVSGVNSVLNFPALTNITGGTCTSLGVQAFSGGTVILTNVAVVTDGVLSFLADGTNSTVNLARLSQSPGTRTVAFEARNAGTIILPLLTGGQSVDVTLKSGGVLPAAQMIHLSGITVNGMTVNFPALTNFTAGSVDVSGGGVVSIPNLTAYNKGTQCSGSFWTANGSNSVLNFPALTNITGGTCTELTVRSFNGGTVILTNVVTVPDGNLYFLADGTNSLVNLTRLSQSPGTRTVAFEARNGGNMAMPLLPGGAAVTVTLKSGGTLPVSQLNQLISITVSDMPVNFPALTSFNAGSINVSGGGAVTIPNLTAFNKGTLCSGSFWFVSGANSVLNFPALTNITGGTCTDLDVRALDGGSLILTNVTTITEGLMSLLSDGASSLVNLVRLQQVPGTLRRVEFEVRNTGTILLPIFVGGETVEVVIKSNGAFDTAKLRLVKSLTVSGTSLNLPGITNLFDGDLIVELGAVLTLPNLFSHNQGGSCISSTWSVTGAGSELNLSSMTNIIGGSCNALNIQALSGGLMNLSNLVTVTDGLIAFLGDGTNSRVDLGKLKSSLAAARTVSFEARNVGNISMPQMSGGATVSVIIKTNGLMSTTQLARLNSIKVVGTNVTFTSLTNIDDGSFSVSNAATVLAPNLLTYAKADNCLSAAWIANGTGSVLNLPGLTQIIGGTCTPLNLQAVNGGQILLNSLGNIPSRTVHVFSSGAGSVIGLQSLSNFLNASSLSKLTATNSGAIQLSEQPYFLSGVQLHFATNTPGFPPTFFAPTNLIMHGRAWHSYWVENRDTTSALNPWLLFMRVPLTNDFQIIGTVAPASREFRAYEFIADPFALELTAVPAAGLLNIVLYAPTNQSFTIQTVTNLVAPVLWQTLDTISMTNTFRILAPQSLAEPKRFFRVNPL